VGKQNDMSLTDTSRNEITNSLSILKVIAGVVLLVFILIINLSFSALKRRNH